MSASALASSNAVIPCDQVGRDLQSNDIPASSLSIDAVDLEPAVDQADDPVTVYPANTAEAPILYLTPRVTNILRDVFGAPTDDEASEVPAPSTSPVADSDTPTEPSVTPAEDVDENTELPRYQRQMYRKDI